MYSKLIICNNAELKQQTTCYAELKQCRTEKVLKYWQQFRTETIGNNGQQLELERTSYR